MFAWEIPDRLEDHQKGEQNEVNRAIPDSILNDISRKCTL
jgi:hypothetical protein